MALPWRTAPILVSLLYMNIANPIYDVVFKYLMEDNTIAKILISSIIEQEVLSLEFNPQESTLELPEHSITVYRLDFTANIKTPDGTKAVLIEIQKSQLPSDIMRFRKYLGEQYRKMVVQPASDIAQEEIAIPIITVYFLGHALDHFKCPVLQVLRQCRDGITKELLIGQDEFVENLTHDCYIIQIPYLHKKRRSELETLLGVFDQSNRTDDQHILNVSEEDFPEKFRPLIRRLQRAIAEPVIRKSMDIEDEILNVLQKKERQIAQKEKELEESKKTIAEKEKTIEEREKAIAVSKKTIEEKEKAIAVQNKIIEELRSQIKRTSWQWLLVVGTIPLNCPAYPLYNSFTTASIFNSWIDMSWIV